MEEELGRGELWGRDLENVFGVFEGGGKVLSVFSMGARI